jgi:SAM-dependent methyltransferase
LIMSSESTTATSEFDAYVDGYEEACAAGLRLSGESRDFFAERRVSLTARNCRGILKVRRVLDFGCGPGHTTPHLVQAFPEASLLGVDNSEEMIKAAQSRYEAVGVAFVASMRECQTNSVDLVYCNGVFHHIAPQERAGVLAEIRDRLLPGGVLSLWENNPWNLGTRIVMSRIPFDRNAEMLSTFAAVGLVRSIALEILRVSYHFYFPSSLRFLRPLERWLERVPLGAQYCVLARRPVG